MAEKKRFTNQAQEKVRSARTRPKFHFLVVSAQVHGVHHHTVMKGLTNMGNLPVNCPQFEFLILLSHVVVVLMRSFAEFLSSINQTLPSRRIVTPARKDRPGLRDTNLQLHLHLQGTGRHLQLQGTRPHLHLQDISPHLQGISPTLRGQGKTLPASKRYFTLHPKILRFIDLLMYFIRGQTGKTAALYSSQV